MKKEIEVFEYTKDILQALKEGVLLTTKSKEKVNTMTISWGALGIQWSKPIFTLFIRENRFTKQILEENPEFTINIPYGNVNREIMKFCGTKTGRENNKIKELNLTLEEPNVISVPGIKELPLTLECKVIYKQKQDKQLIPEEIKKEFYPQDVDSSFCGKNKDFSTVFNGEIVNAYIIE
ncbi:flavin reductase family protein [Anaerosacchariphilus polymeriproducens]|uniref:Flavin reductase family protein n=1 Tax=Anaerosacchariphilus polymeriproducens TaxID=1812858 RepID=A0A371AYN3_9FIRM|nr:flavin reductase family protein [Anaerosacchariphilus polymeriproducens]RDU24659.1 flavin reductase family protein [Anaerosacchariphilus polymeriproducens]